jgi:uncharacterized protein (DUF952 family)
MQTIFHLVIERELGERTRDGLYLPVRFAEDGFIHCTGDVASTLEVAESYFSAILEPVLALELDLARIRSRVVFEAPIPIPGAGGVRKHLREGRLFPHIYGPLNVDAILSRRVLVRAGERFEFGVDVG